MKPPLTFEEFAQNFIRDSKISEENFLKYCDDFVNGKDSYYAYKTFKVVQNYIPVYKKVVLHLQGEMDRSNGVPP
ncbi:MAG: hypothetical protein N2490_03975 [Ignavibacteria bacterium]|nr:hypothetical protein [Ignavibacteria bacterium]